MEVYSLIAGLIGVLLGALLTSLFQREQSRHTITIELYKEFHDPVMDESRHTVDKYFEKIFKG